jgi:predicted metal-dependent hydrolase
MHPLLRFTLDLFEENKPLAPVSRAQEAIENIAIKPSAPVLPMSPVAVPTAGVGTPEARAPIHFRHPRASRELRLGEALVAFEFKRGQRRSIGFSVGPEGLAVRAPKWVTLSEVDAALKTKADWILRKLQEARERHARLATHTIDWRDGASLLFLGQMVTLQLDPSHDFGAAGAELRACGSALDATAQPLPSDASALTLCVSLPRSASPEQIKDVVQAWLMRQATRVFQERLDHFAPLLGVQWKKLGLSNASTRWGSAKADGSIRLNWRLIHMRMSVLDYVVVHELSHLRVMDHSPRFWDTVRSLVPDYAALRRQLKDHPASS